MTSAALFAAASGVALAVARSFVIPGLEAADVQQEALLAAWQACRRFDAERGNLRAWVALWVKNRLLSLKRAEERTVATVPLDEEAEEIAAEELPVERAALSRIHAQEIAARARELANSDRDRLILYFVENGLTLAELAQAMGVTRQTASTLKQRFLARLRLILEGEAGE